jgi:YVTN family beta-propeller protein
MYRPRLAKGIVTALFKGVAGAAALAAAVPALATPSLPFPTYNVGPQADGSTVMSTNQTITPAGTLVKLGTPTRGKAIAVNPNPTSHTGAVLQMGASSAVQIFDLVSGQVVQSFSPNNDSSGSFTGIVYSADGSKLLFSQDSSHLAVATVNTTTGLITGATQVSLPSPIGNAYPGGVAISADGTTGYVLLNQNNTLGVVDLTKAQPKLVKQIRVGNVPNSIVLSSNRAYISNEGGRVAKAGDFTDNSAGTPIVTNPKTDSASTGTVSVVNLETLTVENNIKVGLHPTGLALVNGLLYVANAYSDTVSVVDTAINKVIHTINVGVPLPNTLGTTPTGLAVNGNTLYVTLFTVNAIAVVDLTDPKGNSVIGYIPTASTPSTIAFDQAHSQLVVSNHKGIGTDSITVTNEYNDTAYNSHPDTGTVNLIPIPTDSQLADYTAQVWQNNHWDLTQNVQVGPKYINPNATPVAIPEHIGEPSLIKHVFLIIKENRTFDQVFGDVTTANGNPSLAVFAPYTPNQHAFLQRFATLDNVYAPSRQSADGHPWIVSGIAAYADESQSPDWVRSYPGGNGYDSMVYTPRGFLWDAATAQGLTVKLYGEWSGSQNAGNYSWSDWYAYSQFLEGKIPTNPTTITSTTDTETSTIPSVISILDPHYPSFNTGIPDQYRVDYWLPIFNNQETTKTLPALTVIWLPDDHTSGYSTGLPIPSAAQADNDLALGRIVQAITNSPDWATSAIFVEEDDAQDGVDHVDGHRQPVQVISPYAIQSQGAGDHTIYTSASIDRTIEQILGLTPMTEFDLVASPMRTAFTNTPVNIAPFTALAPTISLNTFPTNTASKSSISKLKNAWIHASNDMFRGKINKADSVDENVLNHVIWYSTTGFTRPYPGDKKVLMPAELKAAGHSAEIED